MSGKNNRRKFNRKPNKDEIRQGLRILVTWFLVLAATWFLFRGNNSMLEQNMPKQLGYSEFFEIVKKLDVK